MVKDRLPELKKLHKRFTLVTTAGLVEERGALDFGYDILTNNEYAEDILHEASLVWKDISLIRENVNQLNLIHEKMLSSPVVDKALKRDAEYLTEDIKEKYARVILKIKEYEKEYSREERENPTSAKLRIIETQRSALINESINVMRRYNSGQVNFQERLKDRFKRQLEIAGHSATNEELEDMLQSGKNPSIFAQDIQFGDIAQAKQVLAEIAERHKEILELEKSITDLHALFTDMAVLVTLQGNVIDRIEENVSKAVHYCEKAKYQTKKAHGYQRKRRKKLLIVGVLTLILLGLIIGLIIAFSGKKK